MSRIYLQPSSTAQWHALVNEAQASADRHLEEEVQSYLVFLLMRFVQQPDLLARALGLDFLKSMHQSGQRRQDQLQRVGDQCLLVSGLFPGQALRRLVSLEYFISLGQTAYHELSDTTLKATGQMFASLSEMFVQMVEVLHAVRSLNGEDSSGIMQWVNVLDETGSEVALQQIKDLYPGVVFDQKGAKH